MVCNLGTPTEKVGAPTLGAVFANPIRFLFTLNSCDHHVCQLGEMQ